jgi:hypothetical protein
LETIVDADGKVVCTVSTYHPEAAAEDTACLFNRVITQQGEPSKNPVYSFKVYHRAVKYVRHSVTITPRLKTTPRGEIKSFTPKSRTRLKFLASNCPHLISHFGMSYHRSDPDGATVKKHLNSFCTALRRHFPGVGYLWLLEFQSRGKAHLHFFSTLEPTAENGHSLAYLWNRIAEPASPKHLEVHKHANNFIAWSMGTGAYACKYIGNDAQKCVPEGFSGVGRFWGNSRGLLPEPVVIEACDLAAAFGEHAVKSIVRVVGKHHETSLKLVGSPWKSRARTGRQSYTLPNGAGVFNKLCSTATDIATFEDIAFTSGEVPY